MLVPTASPPSPTDPDPRSLRQRDVLPPEALQTVTATVVGVGAIGRQVALQLAAIGTLRLVLIDPDTVEAVNLGPQAYASADVGRSKVDATADDVRRLFPEIDLTRHPRRFQRRSDANPDVLFCCVDAIDTRRYVWEAVRDRVRLFVDGRMAAEAVRVLAAADARSRDHYGSTLFPAAESFRAGCTSRSTVFTANVAAGLMLEQFSRWLRGLPVDADLQFNLFSSELTVST